MAIFNSYFDITRGYRFYGFPATRSSKVKAVELETRWRKWGSLRLGFLRKKRGTILIVCLGFCLGFWTQLCAKILVDFADLQDSGEIEVRTATQKWVPLTLRRSSANSINSSIKHAWHLGVPARVPAQPSNVLSFRCSSCSHVPFIRPSSMHQRVSTQRQARGTSWHSAWMRMAGESSMDLASKHIPLCEVFCLDFSGLQMCRKSSSQVSLLLRF